MGEVREDNWRRQRVGTDKWNMRAINLFILTRTLSCPP